MAGGCRIVWVIGAGVRVTAGEGARRLGGALRAAVAVVADVVALAGQRSAEEPDLVADDVAARGSGDAQCRDTELGRPQPDDRAARGDPAAARAAAAPALAAAALSPESQNGSRRPKTRPTRAEAVHDLGVDRRRQRQQSADPAGHALELARGLRARRAVGQVAAHAL